LLNKFLKEKSIRLSEKTITVYRSNLTIFFTWNLINNENKFFINIKKLEFSDFLYFCAKELKVGSLRINAFRSMLSSFSIFIEKYFDEEYPMFRNIILKTIEPLSKESRREKTILSDTQIESLLKYLSETDKQKACWLALAVTSGARFSELLRFETTHIDESHTAFGDMFLETIRQIKTKGRGSSGKLLYKYILKDKFLPYYKEWIDERKSIMSKKNQFHDFLFIKENGAPATIGSVRLWFENFSIFLGAPFYPHACRHYLVTLFSKKNIPYTLIKEIVGWNSIEMCSIYDDTSPKDKVWKELDNLKD
jgi:integrase